MMNNKIEAVIFDVDGLLLNTEDVIDHLVQQYAIYTTQKPLSEQVFRDLRARMFGRTPIESAQLLHDVLGLPVTDAPENYLAWREPLASKMFATSKLLPGAEKLIRHLVQHNIPMGLGTSTPRDLLNIKFSSHPDVLQLFGDIVVTSDAAPGGKAVIFRKVAEQVGVAPIKCLILEDAPAGVEAAKKIGATVVAVPHPLLDRSLVANADQVLDSLEDFQPEQWGLPPY